MGWQQIGPWEPRFAWLPTITTQGDFAWLCWIERRTLRYLYNDGHDDRRDRQYSFQYRRKDVPWP